MDATADVVLLGDLSAYVSLSGYRLRLAEGAASASPAQFIVVGMPAEKVELTFLRKRGGTWVVHVQAATVGADGRVLVTLAA